MYKIKRIKIGLKLWSTNSVLLEEAVKTIENKLFDYIELLVVPGTKVFNFTRIKIPYIIHIAHDKFGFNPGDSLKKEISLTLIKEGQKWADILQAKYIILHPGFGEFKEAENLLEEISDKRILIENMPKIGINNEKMIGYTLKQVKELMGKKFGLCLDFGHAVKSALTLGIDYKQYIKEFLNLNPQVIHVSDGRLIPGKDEHLNIGEGEYDFNFLTECIKKNNVGYITLETPRNNSYSLGEDIKNIKKIKSFFKN